MQINKEQVKKERPVFSAGDNVDLRFGWREGVGIYGIATQCICLSKVFDKFFYILTRKNLHKK